MATEAARRVAQHLDRQFGPIDRDVMAERIDDLTGLPELIAVCEKMLWTLRAMDTQTEAVRETCDAACNALRIAREGRQ